MLFSPSLSQAQPIKLIYAYGTTDDITYHGARRGTKEVNLLNYIPRTSLPNRNYLNVTVNNVGIQCKFLENHWEKCVDFLQPFTNFVPIVFPNWRTEMLYNSCFFNSWIHENVTKLLRCTYSRCCVYLHLYVLQITIPPIQTYYHCKVMNFSNLNTKLHIYQVMSLFFIFWSLLW